MAIFKGFPRDTVHFLEDLHENNNRDWFAENKQSYEEHFLAPALEFIAAMAKPLEKAAPLLVASPKKSGGSLMRIYRDTRFSKEKVPYKTNIGIQFRHECGKDIHAPGVYVHISPEEFFVGAGMWRPDAAALKQIRAHIDHNRAQWTKMLKAKAFSQYELYDDRLKTAPRGIDKSHPMLDFLRLKSFIVMKPLGRRDVESPDLVKNTIAFIRQTKPLMATLCEAVGQPF